MPLDVPLGIQLKTMTPYNVMIASESTTERKLLIQYFKSAKFNVICEAKEREGILTHLKALNEQIDVICIDFAFANSDGLELISKIREISQRSSIMLVSNQLRKETIDELLKLKINSLLLKPINKSSVYEKLIHLLGRKDLFDKMVVGYKTVGLVLSEIQIPPISDVMSKVLNFDASKSGGSNELENLLTPDKALCADILRIANSAFYGRSGKVTQLRDAITLMGLKTIKNIVLIQSRKKFTKTLSQPIFKKHLTELPILTGLVAFDLLNPLGQKKYADEVLLASIFRKIGMTVLALNVTQKYLDILDNYEDGVLSLFQIEQEELNTDSIQIGLKIFKLWNMPPLYQSIIANQGFEVSEILKVNDIDRILRLAEILAEKMLRIKLSEEDEIILNKIFEFYKVQPNLIELFSEDYYSNIKEHPFFESI